MGSAITRYVWVLAAGLLAITAGTDAAFACHVPWVSGGGTRGTMTVRSGQPCDITFRTLGPVQEVRIVKRPAHGTLSVGSANKVTYQSRSGFTGADTFHYAYIGRSPLNRPAKLPVTIAVTVTQ